MSHALAVNDRGKHPLSSASSAADGSAEVDRKLRVRCVEIWHHQSKLFCGKVNRSFPNSADRERNGLSSRIVNIRKPYGSQVAVLHPFGRTECSRCSNKYNRKEPCYRTATGNRQRLSEILGQNCRSTSLPPTVGRRSMQKLPRNPVDQ